MGNEATGFDGPSNPIAGPYGTGLITPGAKVVLGKSVVLAGGSDLQGQIKVWAHEMTGMWLPAVVREVTRILFHQIVDASPVATGRFASFWQISEGEAITERIVTYNEISKTGKRYFGHKLLIGEFTKVTGKSKKSAGEAWDFGGSAVKANKIAEIDAFVNRHIGSAGSAPVYHLTNSLPYARRLEYGYSKQAPVGMVRKTMESGNVDAVIAQVLATMRHGRGA